MVRPRIITDTPALLAMNRANFSNVAIARYFGVSARTVRNTLARLGVRRHTRVNDAELTDRVNSIRQTYGYGIVRSLGALRAAGLRVSRERVRQTLRRLRGGGPIIDPIRRRRYIAPGPNSVWHIDTHHKLARWGIYLHGCIDGYSRYCIYLHAAASFTKREAALAFVQATTSFGVPAHVRGDRGSENFEICELMFNWRGVGRGFIAGRSVHNTRIERLWRDVYFTVTYKWVEFFYDLENTGVLDPNDPVHKFVLRSLYLPPYNQELRDFQQHWNNHSLRTQQQLSPMQLYFPVLRAGPGQFQPRALNRRPPEDLLALTTGGVDRGGVPPPPGRNPNEWRDDPTSDTTLAQTSPVPRPLEDNSSRNAAAGAAAPIEELERHEQVAALFLQFCEQLRNGQTPAQLRRMDMFVTALDRFRELLEEP